MMRGPQTATGIAMRAQPRARTHPDRRRTLVRISSPAEHLSHFSLGGRVVAERFQPTIVVPMTTPNTTRKAKPKTKLKRMRIPTAFQRYALHQSRSSIFVSHPGRGLSFAAVAV